MRIAKSSRRRPCIHRPIIATLSLFVLSLFFSPKAAQATAADVINELVAVQNAVLQAAQQHLEGDVDGAVATLEAALMALDSIQEELGDPALADEVGRSVRAVANKVKVTKKKVTKAQVIVQNGRKKAKLKLNKLRSASKSAFKAASKLGRPLLAELNARSAGFHKPGNVVELQLYAVGCDEEPVLTVANSGTGNAVDVGSTGYDPNTGIITIQMGEDAGGAQVTVTACEQSSTVLLYNYGSNSSTQGLPKGFPKNLPQGEYSITYWATGAVSIPETSLGNLALQDAKSFADEIVEAGQTVMSVISSISGCSASTKYSPFDGSSFKAIWNLRCSIQGTSVSEKVVFNIERL